jgi:cation:H+ antiporter
MSTPLLIILIIAGIALVVLGADWLVDGASSIARRLGVSDFVIGLTIVGFGTSCPELVVSLTGAIKGLSDVAVGNVIGSNIFNSLLILGLTALISPVAVSLQNKRRDIPVMLLVTFVLVFCGMSHTILGLGDSDGLSRVEGIIFLLLFAGYIFFSFKTDRREVEENGDTPVKGMWAAVGLVLLGLAALVAGGHLGVNYGVELARRLGVSEKFIAITLLAGGTSLPELATCIAAAIKRRDQMALGNILGSNVFNILLILGCSAVVRPVSFAGVDLVDICALAGSAVLIWLSSYSFKKDRVDRYEGVLFLVAFIAYYVWLFQKL